MEDSVETLYVQNLNEKLKPADMKILLYQLFAQYGYVLDINTNNTYRMRGQAFVVYESREDALNAMGHLQNYYFYGKPLRICVAKARSDIVTKREGTYLPRDPQHSVKQRAYFFQKLKEKQSRTVPVNGFHDANNILFADGLDTSLTEHVLSHLFGLYAGFKEVRLIQEKGVAFIEYASPQEAAVALTGLKDFRVLPTCALSLAYAKK